MTNPLSPPDADTSNAASPGDKKTRNPRKGPRRATAPAGAPASSAKAAPALLTVGADGMVVPSPSAPLSTDDAGHSPAADAAPSAVVGEGDAAAGAVEDGDAEDETVESVAGEDGEGEEDGQVAEVAAEVDENHAESAAEIDDAVAEIEGSAEPQSVEADSDKDAPETDAPESPDDSDASADADSGNENEEPEPTAAADTAESTGPSTLPADGSSETVSDNEDAAPAETAIEVDDAAAQADGSTEPQPVAVAADEEAPETDAPDDSDASADADAGNKDDDPEPAAETDTAESTAPATLPVDGSRETDSESAEADEEAPEREAPESPDDSDAPANADAGNKNEDPEPAADADSDSTPAEAQDAAPLSRRERRLAEQKAAPGVKPSEKDASEAETRESGPAASAVSAVAPVSPAVSISADRPNTAKPAKERKSIAAMVRGLFVLLVIAVVVAATGTVLAGQKDDVVGPSSTEVNRQAAWERTTALLAQATELGKAASTPKLQQALGKTAADLATQAAALGDGLPPKTAVATTEATAAAAATVSELVIDLKASGSELLNNAATADQAMGRVFAAAGTSQLLQGQQLRSAIGNAPAASELSAARVNFPQPSGPQCSSTLEPRPGVTVDSALLAAAHAEQKAVYAYQVATTRFAEPQFGKASQMLQRHQQKLDLLNAELTVRCLPLAVPVAGFTLDQSFTSTPAPALAGLEAELGTIYADLAALSTPAATDEPAGSESTASARPAASAAPSGSAVEKSQPEASAVQAANNGLLRQMSVAWLLDSSAAQLYWGGTVGPLAGMKP